MTRTSILYPCLIAALALGAGCKKEEPPPAGSPAPAASQNAPAARPPVQAAVTSATAAAGQGLQFGKRKDPFKPLASAVPPAGAPGAAAPQKARPAGELLPIQGFETAQFKVSGIIAGITENRALVVDPNGKGYVVQKGMLIGSNDGRVSRITSNSVEVVERYREDTGRIRQRTIVLTLTKKR